MQGEETSTSGASSPPNTAVTYLRVSTKEQAERGGREEGFSIPAQREGCTRKAASLDAVIVAEFTVAGESGTSAARRPELQKLLAYVREPQVDYCIVHKLDRLARSSCRSARTSTRPRRACLCMAS